MASLGSTAGGGGASTLNSSWQLAVPPRPSSTWPVTTYRDGGTPVVSRSTSAPEPMIWPTLECQENVSGSLSGSLAAATMCTRSPGWTAVGLTAQLMVGGRLGRASTWISAAHVA